MSSLTFNNIVNPKSLEKQLKLVEGRIQELQTEIRELEKVRTACLVLLGNPAEFATAETPAVTAEPVSKTPKKKIEKKSADQEAEDTTDFAPPTGTEISENAPTTEIHQ